MKVFRFLPILLLSALHGVATAGNPGTELLPENIVRPKEVAAYFASLT